MTSRPAAICRELRLREFRNFTELELTLPPEGVALIGDNGEGKTNLVEALYYLEIFRSFRGAPDGQLIRDGTDAFYLRGRFVDRYRTPSRETPNREVILLPSRRLARE